MKKYKVRTEEEKKEWGDLWKKAMEEMQDEYVDNVVKECLERLEEYVNED